MTTYDYEDKTGNDNLGDRVEKITIDTNDMELMTFTYTYDAVGNCLTRINNVPLFTYEYTYDDTYRLLEADAPTGQYDETYTYDDVGNWVTQTRNGSHSFSVNSLNQYTAIDGTRQPTYDNSGNMTSNGLNKTYSYDSENRLMSTTMGSTSSVEYDYDPFGRRVIKDHDDDGVPIVARYVYDGPHCIVEYDGDGYWMNKYIYGPGIDEPLMMINISGETQTKYYYHRDALGSVMALSNAANYIVEGYTYSAFGIATVNRSPGTDDDWLTPDGATGATSPKGNPYMFTGRRYDGETGLYYYRARYYDATLGRFISADPISYYGGMNLYAYVNNNPVNWTDPMGMCPVLIGPVATNDLSDNNDPNDSRPPTSPEDPNTSCPLPPPNPAPAPPPPPRKNKSCQEHCDDEGKKHAAGGKNTFMQACYTCCSPLGDEAIRRSPKSDKRGKACVLVGKWAVKGTTPPKP